jgi:hypothetical protein
MRSRGSRTPWIATGWILWSGTTDDPARMKQQVRAWLSIDKDVAARGQGAQAPQYLASAMERAAAKLREMAAIGAEA